MSDWMLYETNSPWASDSRGLNLRYVFSRDGRHVATCIQESYIRLADEKIVAKL